MKELRGHYVETDDRNDADTVEEPISVVFSFGSPFSGTGMAWRCEGDWSLQSTKPKNTAQSNLLCPSLMKTPYVWDWEKQKTPIGDDIGYRIADEECVDVHGTSRVRGLVPL